LAVFRDCGEFFNRLGAYHRQRIELGVIASYDSGANTAFVRLSGSQANVVGPLPVGLGLAAAGPPGLVGTRCLVVLLDESNPNDGIVVALY